MRKFGLIGYPLSHSFSQRFFTDKFGREHITDCSYGTFPLVNIRALQALLDNEPELCGLNVTIPYKQQVIPYLHTLDKVVEEMQACNCISIKDGKLTGYNTDVIGFEQSLEKKWKPHHTQALVLGTGGAAKAVEYVLRKRDVQYKLVSRNPDPLVGTIGYGDINADMIGQHTLIINTTPLGMFPEVNECPPLPYELITPKHYLFDLVYNPSKTLFLQHGEWQGADIMNGHDMLIIQAEESWKIWNDLGE